MNITFHDTTHEAVANNEEVKKYLIEFKEKCLATANKGEYQIKFDLCGLTTPQLSALKIFTKELPVSVYTGDSIIFNLV